MGKFDTLSPNKGQVKSFFSATWFTCTNGLMGFIGGLLFFVSIFNAAKSGDVFGGLGSAGIKGTITAGVILMLTSILGCVAIRKRSTALMTLYLILSLAMALLVISAGFLLTFFINNLNNVEGDDDAATFSDKVESQINDFIVAVFNSCCSNFNGVEKLKGCSDPTNENAAACFVFIEQYKDALERVIQFDLCNALGDTDTNINGDIQPLVGDPNSAAGGCANGNGALFKDEFTQLMEDQLNAIGGISLALGFVLFINFLATITLTCRNRDKYYDFDDEYYRGTVAYGGGTATRYATGGSAVAASGFRDPTMMPPSGPPGFMGAFPSQPYPGGSQPMMYPGIYPSGSQPMMYPGSQPYQSGQSRYY